MRVSLLSVATLALLIPLSASARVPNAGQLAVSSTGTQKILEVTDTGRTVRALTTLYNAGGLLTGTRDTHNEYEGQRLTRTWVRHFDADETLTRQWVTTYHHLKTGQLDKVTRRYLAGDDAVLRYEVSQWHYEHKPRAAVRFTTVETTQYDPDEAVTGTRYTIHHSRKVGQMWRQTSSDMSVFDAQGVQKSRSLTEFKTGGLKRWMFDDRDEVARVEVEEHERDARGRLVQIVADITDGEKQALGSRLQRFSHNADGRVRNHTTTWYDETDQATQRRTMTNVWKRGINTPETRTTWERWTVLPSPGR